MHAHVMLRDTVIFQVQIWYRNSFKSFIFCDFKLQKRPKCTEKVMFTKTRVDGTSQTKTQPVTFHSKKLESMKLKLLQAARHC